MSAMPDPYGYSPPSPWWSGKSYGTSGGVKLSLVTEQRSEKPSFWEPRPVGPSASASPSVTARPPFSPSTSVASPTTPANTRSLDSVRQVLASRNQGAQQNISGGDTDSQSVASSKDTTPYYTRQWRNRDDRESTPGTPSSADHHHPHAQTYVEWRAQKRGRGRGRGRGQGRGGGWYYNHESEPDAGHTPHLDARAQEFVPGQVGATEARVPELESAGSMDLNEYIRAGSVAETIGSSRVSVFGSRSRSHTPSEVEDDRDVDVRCTERERAEAERQWHLQTSWDDEDNAGDEWTGNASAVVQGKGEAREGVAGAEVLAQSEWESGVVLAPVEDSVPVPIEVPDLALVDPSPPPPPPPTTANAVQKSSPTLPFGSLLERAKMIPEGAHVAYPENIKPPDAQRNPSAKCYDRDFLLQFQNLCTGRPSSVPYIAPFWHSILGPYELRPAPVRTKEKWVQTSLVDDAPLENRSGEHHTVNIGVETNRPSNDGDATARIVDVVYNQLAPDGGGRQLSLGGSMASSGEITCRDTPTRDEHTFEYEVQEAQRERLEARVEFLAAEVKVLRLELARIRKLVG